MVFSDLITEQNKTYLHEMMAAISAGIVVEGKTEDDYWVAYGSIVLNDLKAESDIDVLYIVAAYEGKPYRHQAYYNNRPVTVYVCNEACLKDDGESFYYGGYFSGKLLSPHIILAQNDAVARRAQDLADYTVGAFLSNFLYKNEGVHDSGTSTPKEVLNAYLDICPWYKAYLLKFFSSPVSEQLYSLLPEHYLRCLSKYDQQNKPLKDNDIHKNRIRAISRFWSYGAIEHGLDHMFADMYFDKAEATIKQLDPDGSIWSQISTRLEL